MTKFVNSFALLDDEEGDDVEVLVDRIVKKVEIPLIHPQNGRETSDFVENENGGRRGGQGSGVNGYGGNDDVQGGHWNGHRRNYSRDSYGSRDGIKDDGHKRGDGRSRGRQQGRGRGYGGDDGTHNVNEADEQNDDGGWQDVSKSHGKGHYANYGSSFGDEQRKSRNGNRGYDGERRGYEDQVQDNDAGSGQRRHRNGNWNHDGERRGYENQAQDNDAANGQRRYRNGSLSSGGERRGYRSQVQDNDAGSELLDGGLVNGDNKFRGEDRTYGNGNQNYSGERRAYGGYRGRGRLEYQKTGSGDQKENGNSDYANDVKSDNVNGSGGDVAVVLEASNDAETEENNTSSEKVNGNIRDAEEETEEQKKEQFEDPKLKKKEEEDMESKLMTLDQYEKLLLEKRQALEFLKTEERKVAIDKELEGMKLIKKKQDLSDDEQKSVKDKLKMKDSLRKTEANRMVIETEVDDSDAKLNSKEEKLKKEGSLEKKEKGRKLAAVEVHDFFKPAFRHRSFGGRGQGLDRHGRGDQGGFNDRANGVGHQTNGDGAVPTPATAPPRRRTRAPLRIPTDKDFPVLSAAPAPVNGSA
ncbi:hypothetical protein BVRB_7g168270 [Beta vulgaris subsp. vulgaris]|uniref:Hyaluronan/mRNA-binding protein domain-containing protein n=1 Tax=Beta vulgaris subsp. vulgaris TaxID=3555 RepID=A0A0J8BZW7_BETVV|nr:hypothetical protein BVRB_7g168270 [Beta vulgaris subsp. vulgaris]